MSAYTTGFVSRVLVCGSRTYPEDDDFLTCVLQGIDDMYRVGGTYPVIIEGGARGADRAAHDYVQGFGSEYPRGFHEQYPADWDRHGKRAGYLRNVQMLEQGQPDLVLAFIDKPLADSKGTAMMVDLARKAGVPTYVIQRAALSVDPDQQGT